MRTPAKLSHFMNSFRFAEMNAKKLEVTVPKHEKLATQKSTGETELEKKETELEKKVDKSGSIEPTSPKVPEIKNSDDDKVETNEDLQPKCPLCQNEFGNTESLCKHLKQVHTCSDVTIQEAIAPYSRPKLAQIEVKKFANLNF